MKSKPTNHVEERDRANWKKTNIYEHIIIVGYNLFKVDSIYNDKQEVIIVQDGNGYINRNELSLVMMNLGTWNNITTHGYTRLIFLIKIDLRSESHWGILYNILVYGIDRYNSTFST